MKKYQQGGNLQSTRAMMNALRTMRQQTEHGQEMGGLFQQKVMGESREKLDKEIEEMRQRMLKESKKGGSFMKKMGFLDFIPGGKWLKTAVKGIGGAKYAGDLKDLAEQFGGFGSEWQKSFLGKEAKKTGESYKGIASKLPDPGEVLFKSILSDVVSQKGGETFKEAFGDTSFLGKDKTGKGSTSVSTASDFIPEQAPLESAGNVGLSDISMAGDDLIPKDTPWKDQALAQFGLGEGQKFKDIFDLKEEGSSDRAYELFSNLGFIEGEGGLFDSPFFHAGEEQDAEGKWGNIWKQLMGNTVEDYLR